MAGVCNLWSVAEPSNDRRNRARSRICRSMDRWMRGWEGVLSKTTPQSQTANSLSQGVGAGCVFANCCPIKGEISALI